MAEYDIAVIPGDGIGPEVVEEGAKVLKKAAEGSDLTLNFAEFPFGADHYLKSGEVLSDESREELGEYDAIYLGAVGDPRVDPGILEKGILLNLRFYFEQYVNLRPIRLRHERYSPLKGVEAGEIDMTVVRENTEGLYADSGGFLRRNTEQEVAVQEMVNTHHGVERVVEYAFEYAESRDDSLMLCDKSNVLGYAHDLWQRVFADLSEKYSGVEARHQYVDALTMKMVRDPGDIDTVVTCNLFGDIITDLGAELQGGMGMAVSANINPGGVSMFEPVHGSAPDIAGENAANPLAAILAAAAMMEELGDEEIADRIRSSVDRALAEERITVDMGGDLTTEEMGDFICSLL